MSYVTHAITVMSSEGPVDLATLHALLGEQDVTVVDSRAVPVPKKFAARRDVSTLTLAEVNNSELLKLALDQLSEQCGVDFVLQAQPVRQADYRLAVFDMDSTLIQCEVIDELASLHGVGDAVAAITERAMRGELDFKASFRERLAMLKGLTEGALADVASRLPITEGMPELITTLRGRGIRTAILSGGFVYFANYLQRTYGFDEVHANTLEIEAGAVTGRVAGDIVDGARKAALLLSLAESMGIEPGQVIAVGDGANDLPMLGLSGLGVAFRAKPVVRAAAAHNIRHVGLDGVLYLLGSGSEL